MRDDGRVKASVSRRFWEEVGGVRAVSRPLREPGPDPSAPRCSDAHNALCAPPGSFCSVEFNSKSPRLR